jgi:hypothetical protein
LFLVHLADLDTEWEEKPTFSIKKEKNINANKIASIIKGKNMYILQFEENFFFFAG